MDCLINKRIHVGVRVHTQFLWKRGAAGGWGGLPAEHSSGCEGTPCPGSQAPSENLNRVGTVTKAWPRHSFHWGRDSQSEERGLELLWAVCSWGKDCSICRGSANLFWTELPEGAGQPGFCCPCRGSSVCDPREGGECLVLLRVRGGEEEGANILRHLAKAGNTSGARCCHTNAPTSLVSR